MPSFQYQGRDKNSMLVEGLIEAPTEQHAATKLTLVDIIPIKIQVVQDQLTIEEILVKYFSYARPKLADIALFFNQMAILTKAGVPLVHGLKVICESLAQKKMRSVLTDIIISIESGYSLSKAMAKHSEVFSLLMIAMIEVGEKSGELDVSFTQLKNYLSADLQTHKRIKAALRYPSMVLIAIILAVGMINYMIIPSFKDFFTTFDSALPLPTRILIACSDLFIDFGWFILFVFVTVIVSSFFYLKTPKGQWWWSYAKTKIPFIGSIVQRAIYARFCRAFSITLKGNVPLLQAFKVVSQVADNPYVGQKILLMREHVQRGGSIVQAAKNSNLFSAIALQMLVIGEETGEIDQMLIEVAEFYEKDVDYDLKKLADAIEPLLIIIVAIMVLILALGVFLPMWDISSVALRKLD